MRYYPFQINIFNAKGWVLGSGYKTSRKHINNICIKVKVVTFLVNRLRQLFKWYFWQISQIHRHNYYYKIKSKVGVMVGIATVILMVVMVIVMVLLWCDVPLVLGLSRLMESLLILTLYDLLCCGAECRNIFITRFFGGNKIYFIIVIHERLRLKFWHVRKY